MAKRRRGKPYAAVLRAEAAAGGMRALARLLGVSPSTIHTWRTKGPSAKGKELLKGVKEPERRILAKDVIGPVQNKVRQKAQQALQYIKKLEKRSKAAKKAWRKRNTPKLYATWLDIHAPSGLPEDSKNKERIQVLRVHIQHNTAQFRRFMAAAARLSFATKQAKDFWFSPKALG